MASTQSIAGDDDVDSSGSVAVNGVATTMKKKMALDSLPEAHTNGTAALLEREWCVRSSWTAKNTVNQIRRLVDGMDLQPNPEKSIIALSIGDPTVFGNMAPSDQALDAMMEAVQHPQSHGYTPAHGWCFIIFTSHGKLNLFPVHKPICR